MLGGISWLIVIWSFTFKYWVVSKNAYHMLSSRPLVPRKMWPKTLAIIVGLVLIVSQQSCFFADNYIYLIKKKPRVMAIVYVELILSLLFQVFSIVLTWILGASVYLIRKALK